MIPATHVIMAIHPTLVLLPILGFLVLPCASIHLDKGLRIGANVSLENPGCDKPLCPPSDLCTEAFYDDKKSLCYLIRCPQNICENGTMTNDLLATQGPPSDLCTKTFYGVNKSHCYLIRCPQNICENATMINDLLATQESFHENNNDGAALPHQSSGNNSLLSQNGSSVNENQQLRPTLNISSTSNPTNPPVFLNTSATTVSTKLMTTEAAGSKETTEGVIPTTVPTIPTKTLTPTTITTTTATTTTATTTKPLTTSINTSVTTTVAKTTVPQQPSSPSPPWAETSASISPTVPTTPPSITSSKPVHPSPVETKPSPTTAKTSTLPSVVPSTPPKDNGDQSRTDQAKVEVAGDPLTIHLLNTSSLLAVLMFGLLFFVVTVALFLKQAYESYKRKDYTQVDYLINGMYSDSGV